MEDLRGLLNDMERMFLSYSSFSVEMVLEKCDVRLALFSFGKELVVRRNVHSRGLDLQSHSKNEVMGIARQKDRTNTLRINK